MEELNLGQFVANIIIYLCVFLMGSIWGVSIIKRKIDQQHKITSIPKDDNTKTVSMPGCIMRVEEIDGLMLFYDTANDNFVCQGTTLDESARNFSIVTKNQVAGIFTLNNKRFVFHDAECLPVSDYNESKAK